MSILVLVRFKPALPRDPLDSTVKPSHIVAVQKKEIAKFAAWIKQHEARISIPPPSGK